MTDAQLEKMDIYRDGDKLHPNRYWCNTCQCYFVIPRSYNFKDVTKMIFNEGNTQGIEAGKIKRSNQFKELLNNADLS